MTAALSDRRRAWASRDRLYLGCSLGIRVVWLLLALLKFVVHGLSVAAFSAEFLVVVILAYESHPILLKGLDPRPDDEGNVFVEDSGIQLLITAAVIAYFVPLSQIIGVHLPHAVGTFVHHYLQSTPQAWEVLFGTLFGLAAVFGVYLYRAEPHGAIIRRAAGAILGHEPDDLFAEDQQELAAALQRSERSAKDWATIGLHTFVVGLMVAITALAYGFIFVSVFQVPTLLILVVVLWLAHDLLQHRFDLEAGLGHFLHEFAEEIEQPKRWFLEFEMIEGGLKGIMTTLFIALGIAITGLLASLILGLAFTSFDAIAQAAGFFGAIIAADGLVGFLAKPSQVLVLTNMLLVFVTLAALAPVAAAASAVAWYAILDRVPHWTADFHYEADPEPAEVRPLPRSLLLAVGLAWLAMGYVLVVVAPLVSSETGISTIPLLVGALGLVVLEVVPVVLLRDVLRSFDRRTVPGSDLLRDNHVIIALVVLPFLVLLPVGAYPSRAMVGAMFVATLAYYFADVMHYINEHIGSKIRATAAFQGYVLLFIGAIYFSGLTDAIEAGYIVEVLLWVVAGLLVLDWIVTLFVD